MKILDCPAYLDQDDTVRCGLPAEVQRLFTMRSTDGPLESVVIRCAVGHGFSGPIDSLTCPRADARAPGTAAGAPGGRHGRRTGRRLRIPAGLTQMRPAWLSGRGFRVRLAAVVTASLAVALATIPPTLGPSASASVEALATTATPAISLSPASGPVGTAVQVSGTGFKHKVTIDISFDSTLVATAVTSRKGSFSNASFRVPGAAVPGNHLVTAQDASHPDMTASAAFTVIGVNWPEFRHDLSLSGVDPTEALLGPGNVSSLTKRWAQFTGGVVESSPTVVDGIVYVGSDNGEVIAMNAATGAVLWQTQTRASVTSSPAVASGVVYIGSEDQSVYALDAATGAVLWHLPTAGAVTSSPAIAFGPAIMSGLVYVGSGDGQMYALLAGLNGSVFWHVPTSGAVVSSPAVASGAVYFGSENGTVYAVNFFNGAPIWHTQTGGTITSSPAVTSTTVYIGSEDGKVYALDAATGAVLWTTQTGGAVPSSPAVTSGAVYVGSSDGKVYALDPATGAVLWTTQTGGQVTSSPAVANGVVYVGSFDSNLYALNAATGAVLWKGTTGGGIDSSPAVASGVVYVGSADGNVYSYSLP